MSQYITTVSLYHSIAADHRFAVFTLVQSCVECVVSVTDACPRNDRHVCWQCSTGGQCPGQTGTCATVCPHHRPPTLTSASSQVPGHRTTCSVLSSTVDISLWRPGAALHWAGPLTTPPLHTFPCLHSWARTKTLH